MSNLHNFSLVTGKCVIPSTIVRDNPKLFLETTEKRTMILDQKTIQIGHVTKGRDEHGNDYFYATSTRKDTEIITRTKGAAILFLELEAQISRKYK